MLPLRFGRAWLLTGWLGVLGATVASLTPVVPQFQIQLGDKLGHALVYLVLMLWFGGIYQRRRYPLIAAALFAFGVALEFVQAHVGRDPSPFDVAANSTGILIGFGLAWLALGGWCMTVERWLVGK